ncbi:flagellar basal body L-ring protein FlgH [Roseomonas sp. NAR14]|uniref:Flagellar L-ring protein n=1 Tax=Roseomonas acroporae TaxID=2937791 RepID=A0A9X2BVN5_9PROT|nr:flagellar basal body L-ring protein FlgH [Roseomonas acroporae]MCK8786853.1 flagellar basal body L-ring protein FlgH [Roseomonas acroporae]
MPLPARPLLLLLPLLLAGCGSLDRLARIGRAPELAPVANPTADPNWRPVSMPMPGAQDAGPASASLWRTGSRSFLRDQRAARVGDLVTVLVNISERAQLSNETQTARDNSENFGLPHVLGLESRAARYLFRGVDPANLIDASSTRSTSGTGSVKRNETVMLRIAATVTQLLPNGNLVVSGRQQVRVNNERRDLLVAGVIRPSDIASDNTVQHDRLAEARIAYGGAGTLSDVQQPRYGQQLLDVLMPF